MEMQGMEVMQQQTLRLVRPVGFKHGQHFQEALVLVLIS